MGLDGRMTSGEYLAFAFTFGMVSGVLRRVQSYLIKIRTSEVMAKRVLEVFDYEDENLDDINMDIKKYEKIALVGESGSGKSTLLNILSGMYLPSAGKVNIGGFELKDQNVQSIRNKIALVSQETFLFPKSIYENLIYGNVNVQKSEVIDACKKADIHNFIESLPNKYDTFVGEKGVYLSGGERQRIRQQL